MPEPIDDPRDDAESLDGTTLVDPNKRFSPACLAALRAFRTSKPWRGTPTERQEKITALHRALCESYGIEPPPELTFLGIGEARPNELGTAGFHAPSNRLILAGRLSVASYLWAFARVRGLTNREAFVWSLSLFARMFPRSFAQCRFEGPLLVRDGNQNL